MMEGRVMSIVLMPRADKKTAAQENHDTQTEDNKSAAKRFKLTKRGEDQKAQCRKNYFRKKPVGKPVA